jgi:hypothetical protein
LPGYSAEDHRENNDRVINESGGAGITLAHHSRAEFRGVETTEIEGVLTKVIWRNPHIAIYLDVTTDAGELEPYRIETQGGPYFFPKKYKSKSKC